MITLGASFVSQGKLISNLDFNLTVLGNLIETLVSDL